MRRKRGENIQNQLYSLPGNHANANVQMIVEKRDAKIAKRFAKLARLVQKMKHMKF